MVRSISQNVQDYFARRADRKHAPDGILDGGFQRAVPCSAADRRAVGIQKINATELHELLGSALQARELQRIPEIPQAMRLFNGFSEGYPELVVELFGETLVLFDHSPLPQEQPGLVQAAGDFYRQALPWIQAILIKTRYSPYQAQRQGKLIFGEQADRKVQEHGVWYAIDLTMNQDASLYLDTRNLRRWALDHLAEKRVLNTFAYTGSLGVAARAAGASLVLQLDLNRHFLNLAQASYALNGFKVNPSDFLVGDFFTWVSRLKRMGRLFDCIFLDPPFFSKTDKGRVDQAQESHRLINKIRPLIAQNGWLVTINNALFTSGEAYMETLQNLCADGYLEIEKLIPVPADITGYPHTVVSHPPADPTPFNHATKIAVLRVTHRKAQVLD